MHAGSLVAFLQATVAVFGASAVDPNTATPVAAPVVYASPVCGQTLGTEPPPPIQNPRTGFWEDQSAPGRECRVDLSAQLSALPPATYKGAVRLGAGAYGPLSTEFSLTAAQAHECDGTAPTSGTAVEGSRTVGWCFNGLDQNGNPTTVTSWRVYIDNALATTILPASVTVGSPNAAGLRYHQASVSFTRGNRALQMSAVNATGESARSIVFSALVTAPPAVPSTLQIRDIR